MSERETFVAYGDLLMNLALQCRSVERALGRRAEDDGGLTVELAKWVAERQARVASGLERCAKEGPENLVARRLQFKPSYRAWLGPEQGDVALGQVVALNNVVTEVLAEEAEKSVPVELGEQMDDLTKQVDAINRKISLALVTSGDL